MSTATGSSMGDSVALSMVRTGQDSSKNPVAVVVQYESGTCNLLVGQVYTVTKSKQFSCVLIIIIIPIYIYYCRALL